jgi:hypothetical protein
VLLKNPGKKIRNTLVKKRRKLFKLEDQTVVKIFLEITGASFPGEASYEKLLTLWNCNGLPNRARTFLFRFFNNTLGINTRLSHFVPGHPRGCTFCRLNNGDNVPDETFLHIFSTCPVVRNWQDKFLSLYFPDNYMRNDRERVNLFFIGRVHEPNVDNYFVMLCIFIFQYVIWDARSKKKIPSFCTLNLIFKEMATALLRTNSLVRKARAKSNFTLFRTVPRAR